MKKRHQHRRTTAPMRRVPSVTKKGWLNRHILYRVTTRDESGVLREFTLHATKGYRAMRP